MGSKEDGIPTPELPEHVNYWAIRWQEKRTGWHMEKVNPTLVENIELLTSVPGNPSPSKKILVPLCGKTHDLLYLLGLGHQVFGIEGVHECDLGLGERDGFKFNYNSEESIYHTEDGRLQIYCGDLLEIPIEKWGPFDAVWDRGSLVAVEYSHRQAYKEIMKRSLQVSKDKCKQELFFN
jgi:thiopurine S-methyltransferase